MIKRQNLWFFFSNTLTRFVLFCNRSMKFTIFCDNSTKYTILFSNCLTKFTILFCLFLKFRMLLCSLSMEFTIHDLLTKFKIVFPWPIHTNRKFFFFAIAFCDYLTKLVINFWYWLRKFTVSLRNLRFFPWPIDKSRNVFPRSFNEICDLFHFGSFVKIHDFCSWPTNEYYNLSHYILINEICDFAPQAIDNSWILAAVVDDIL